MQMMLLISSLKPPSNFEGTPRVVGETDNVATICKGKLGHSSQCIIFSIIYIKDMKMYMRELIHHGMRTTRNDWAEPALMLSPTSQKCPTYIARSARD
jgi:hypothetical protein